MWLNIKSEYSSAAGEFDGFFKVVSGGETDQRVDVAAELLTKLITVNEKILDEIKVIGVEMNETRKELTHTHEDLKGAITESHDAVVSVIRDLVNGKIKFPNYGNEISSDLLKTFAFCFSDWIDSKEPG